LTQAVVTLNCIRYVRDSFIRHIIFKMIYLLRSMHSVKIDHTHTHISSPISVLPDCTDQWWCEFYKFMS